MSSDSNLKLPEEFPNFNSLSRLTETELGEGDTQVEQSTHTDKNLPRIKVEGWNSTRDELLGSLLRFAKKQGLIESYTLGEVGPLDSGRSPRLERPSGEQADEGYLHARWFGIPSSPPHSSIRNTTP